MPWHCEMGGKSKSIKSLDSGQGLGDPSPQGDPDNHQILLFKRWHVYKLFKPLSLLGHCETQGFCLLHTVDLLPFFVSVSTGLFPCLFFLFWAGCGTSLWYQSQLTVYAFYVLSSQRNFEQIQQWKHEEFGREKKEAATTLNEKWLGQTLKFQGKETKQQFLRLSIRSASTSMYTFKMVWGYKLSALAILPQDLCSS